MQPTIYISGPITGHPNYKETFDEAEKELTAKGYRPINPAKFPYLDCLEYSEIMELCKIYVKATDYIKLLPGWWDSKGCIEELRTFLNANERQTGKVFTPDRPVPEVMTE